jgi:hypothetical protein
MNMIVAAAGNGVLSRHRRQRGDLQRSPTG